MSRRIRQHEKILYDIVREYDKRFFYSVFSKYIKTDGCIININKEKKQMVAYAAVEFENGDRLDYEMRYNRIVNISDDYTILVPSIKKE